MENSHAGVYTHSEPGMGAVLRYLYRNIPQLRTSTNLLRSCVKRTVRWHELPTPRLCDATTGF